MSGVISKRDRLVIHLGRRDPTFLSLLTMPFFQATSTKLPLSHEVTGPYPSAGPYEFTRNDVNALTSLRRNPYYRGQRRRNLTGLDVQWNVDEQTGFNEVQTGDLDQGPLPEAEVQSIADRYGVNKSRFWAVPRNCISYLAFNNRRPLFAKVAMRKAVNWAVNRTAFAAQGGAHSMTPWTHLIPPRLPGSLTRKRLQPYAVHPDLAKAKRLAGLSIAGKKIRILYVTRGVNAAQAALIRRDLMRLGFKAGNITMEAFTGPYYDEFGNYHSTIDLGVGGGWCLTPELPGPEELLSSFVGRGNPFRVDSPRYRSRLARAASLPQPAKARALGKLDLMRNLAPAAAMGAPNNRYFFSSRVDPRGLVWSAMYEGWSIPALALK